MENEVFQLSKAKHVGQVTVSGAKNSALKLIAASILTDETIKLFNCPNGLLDIQIHLEMLKVLGKDYYVVDDFVKIYENKSMIQELNWDDRSIRNTLLILGALVTRFGKGKVPLPGGCKLGSRKYDLHIMILEKMGAKVWEENGCLSAEIKGRMQGTEIHLPIRSTGATENAILTGSLANGTTVIWNPHIRPEIFDLVNMLNKMGAKIKIYGQKCIEIQGVDKLGGTRHTVIPDNVEAITWAIGSAITNGDVEIINFPFEHLEVPLVFLRESGMKYFRGNNSLIVRGGQPYPIEISTGPYPGINSDMQPLFALYGSCSKGETKIVDLRFPGRYAYAYELGKMGMKFKEEGDLLKISGGNKLVGTNVKADDLRAGVSLLFAGLVAEGDTIIENSWQIDRGYELIEEKLQNLGVKLFAKK